MRQTNTHARARGWVDDPGPTIDKPARPDIGTIGVFLGDNANPPTFWELTGHAGQLGFFRDIANPDKRTNFPFPDFWPLT